MKQSPFKITYFFLVLTAMPAFGNDLTIMQSTLDTQTLTCFLSLKGAFEQETGKLEQAGKTYNALDLLRPNDQGLLLARLQLALAARKYEEIALISKKIPLPAQNTKELWSLVAQSALFSANFDEAEKLFKKLQALFPDDERFDYFLAITLINTKSYDAAATCIDQVLANPRHQSKRFLFTFLKAKLLFVQHRFDEAEWAIDQTLAENPLFSKAIYLKNAIASQKEASRN